MTTPKKRTGRSRTTRSRTTRRKPRATATPAAPPETQAVESSLDTFLEPPTAPTAAPAVEAEPPAVPTSTPEPAFAARVPPPEPERPRPATRRAIFFDVENSSRSEHVQSVLAHLRIDRLGRTTDLVAVGNWRVVSAETSRLLARHGAHLVHSAPATGVKDWSDLRIAVTAGVWLASARPGDSVDIITDDQAFDAVGDVAASLGVDFRRLSYRALAGVGTEAVAAEEPAERNARRRRRGGRGRRGGRMAAAATPPPAPPAPARPAVNGSAQPAPSEAHTAPHDALLAVARELITEAPDRTVNLDALSNALKARGFRRTPGSPRLITRLRRIRELEVLRNGLIRLVAPGEAAGGAHEPPAAAGPVFAFATEAEGASEEPEHAASEEPEAGGDVEAAGEPEGEPAGEGQSPAPAGRRRRRRRGGRGRRGRGGHAAAAAP